VVGLITDTVETSMAKLEATARIQRLAWMIVLVSFLLFCSISIAISGGIYYFFFRSTVPMSVIMQVGRGTAGIETPDNTSFQSFGSPAGTLQVDATVLTDLQSQVTISFQIPQSDGVRILGTITLEKSSSITLGEANLPRFNWSNGVYSLSFDDFVGEANVLIPKELDRPFELYINTPSNATFLITNSGRYSLISNETSINLITIEGRADLLSPNRINNRRVVSGEQAILRTGGETPASADAPTNLLRNGLFTFDIPDGQAVAPLGWGCTRTSDAFPLGEYLVDEWLGRRALRLIRTEGTSTSKTGCEQVLELNIDQYTYLELQVTFAIHYQSLQNCGILGSECPMMLLIYFTDIQGITQQWYQGLFYNYVPQSASYPTQCINCGTGLEHLAISQDVWFTYESGNLFARFPAEQRPQFINKIQFYASGHTYDVFVSELALYAANPAVPETGQLGND
jgi:hypothetical protein